MATKIGGLVTQRNKELTTQKRQCKGLTTSKPKTLQVGERTITSSQFKEFALLFNASYSNKLQSRNVTLSQVAEGCTPTLAEIVGVFNREAVETLVFAWLVGFDAYVGKGCFSTIQLEELTTTIVSKMYHLKIAEVAIFFAKLKEGEYGDVYGKINPLWVTSAFSKFFAARAGVIAENERLRERKEREAQQKRDAETAISYKEYLNLKEEGKL